MSASPQIGEFQSLLGKLGSGPAASPVQIEKSTSTSPRSLPDWCALLARKILQGVSWVLKNVRVQPARKTLRVCESVSLGDRRFVAVIQVNEQRFLIGGGTGSVSLLSQLPETAKAPSATRHSAETDTNS